MISTIHQPHDKFFRLSLGEPNVAIEFFKEHLPSTVLEKINLNTLKLENKSFIDTNYKSTEADVVYSTKVNNSTLYLYLLCEHQSTVDRWMAFRLWIYLTRLMEAHRKQNLEQPLPLVHSMVIYTGEEPWNAPLDIFSLFGEYATLAKNWLMQPYQLLNIHQIPDDEMRKRKWCGVVEFALKNKTIINFKNFLNTLLPWLQELEKSDLLAGSSFSKIVLKYVLRGVEAQDFDFFIKNIQEYLSPQMGDEIMTLEQEILLRGQCQGELALMTSLLQRRFKQIPENYLELMKQADAKTLLAWGEKILDAETLEKVFE